MVTGPMVTGCTARHYRPRPAGAALTRGPPAAPARRLVRERRLDEAGEERMRPQRLRQELRVELHGDVPRVAGQFEDLDELAVGRPARDPGAVLDQDRLVEPVELVPVPVPLVDERRRRRPRAASEPGARSQAYWPRRIVPPRSSTPSRSRSL